MPTVEYRFVPEPKQQLALDTHVDELLYGGAAGGGKSRWGRAEAMRMALLVPGSRTVLFRRTFPQLLRDVIPKFRSEMPRGVARYNKTEKTWYFYNGSIIELAMMENVEDYYNYQSAEYQLVIFEELTQFLEEQYRYLFSRLRTGSGPVSDRMAELGWRPRAISTSNPGGIGHSWVKARWIDYGIRNKPFRPAPTEEDPKPGIRCYVPAVLADNPHIDPDYESKLDMLDPVLAQSLKSGDWNVLRGTRFQQFRYDLHVVQPGDVPLPLVGYPRAVGVDYGLSAPFCALWGALLPGGTIYIYRELYKTGLTPTQQADLIAASEEPGEREPSRPIPVALDPACWARAPQSPIKPIDPSLPPAQSIAWFYRQRFGGQVVRARNDRLAGWALIDEHLRVEKGSSLPRLLIASTCVNLIRTLPALPRAKTNPEDVDTKADDHAADAARYLLMQLSGGGHDRTSTTPVAVVAPFTAGLAEAAF